MLVNSAGILVQGDTASLSVEDYDRCMDINTKAAFVLTRESIPHLIKTKGNIVHISSVTGESKDSTDACAIFLNIIHYTF